MDAENAANVVDAMGTADAANDTEGAEVKRKPRSLRVWRMHQLGALCDSRAEVEAAIAHQQKGDSHPCSYFLQYAGPAMRVLRMHPVQGSPVSSMPAALAVLAEQQRVDKPDGSGLPYYLLEVIEWDAPPEHAPYDIDQALSGLAYCVKRHFDPNIEGRCDEDALGHLFAILNTLRPDLPPQAAARRKVQLGNLYQCYGCGDAQVGPLATGDAGSSEAWDTFAHGRVFDGSE
jgi:hypothetical protein